MYTSVDVTSQNIGLSHKQTPSRVYPAKYHQLLTSKSHTDLPVVSRHTKSIARIARAGPGIGVCASKHAHRQTRYGGLCQKICSSPNRVWGFVPAHMLIAKPGMGVCVSRYAHRQTGYGGLCQQICSPQNRVWGFVSADMLIAKPGMASPTMIIVVCPLTNFTRMV
jgi:hypothetical protein